MTETIICLYCNTHEVYKHKYDNTIDVDKVPDSMKASRQQQDQIKRNQLCIFCYKQDKTTKDLKCNRCKFSCAKWYTHLGRAFCEECI